MIGEKDCEQCGGTGQLSCEKCAAQSDEAANWRLVIQRNAYPLESESPHPLRITLARLGNIDYLLGDYFLDGIGLTDGADRAQRFLIGCDQTVNVVWLECRVLKKTMNGHEFSSFKREN